MPNSDRENGQDRLFQSLPLSEGLVIALATGISYASALMYEVGYLRFFGAPAGLASVDFRQFVLFMIFFGITFWCSYIYSSRSLVILFGKNWKISDLYAPMSIFIPLIIFTFAAFDRKYSIYYFMFVIFISFTIAYVANFLERRGVSPIFRRISSYEYFHNIAYQKRLLSERERKYTLILVFCFNFLIYSSVLGYLDARRAEKYTLSINDGSEIILRIYEDRSITAEYDAEKNTIKSIFYIRSIDDMKSGINAEIFSKNIKWQ